MDTFRIFLALLSVGGIQAFMFNLDKITDEDDTNMPNVMTSSSFSRPIGAAPRSFPSMGVSSSVASATPFIPLASNSIYPPVRTRIPSLGPRSFSSFPSNTRTYPPVRTQTPSLAPGTLFSYPCNSFIPQQPPTPSALTLGAKNFNPNPQLQATRMPTGSFEENDNRPEKRTRTEGPIPVTDHAITRYIEAEVNSYEFIKQVKKDALKKALGFIARNDYLGFRTFEPEFKAVLKYDYHLLKKNKSNYMMHYIIRFGATNFIRSYSYYGRPADKNSNIEGAYEILIATKPLDVVFTFIKSDCHFNRKSVMEGIINAVRNRYPDLHFLDYIVFEVQFSGMTPSQFGNALKIFEAKTEEEKFKYLTELLNNRRKYHLSGPHFTHSRLMTIPWRYEAYFLSLGIEVQFYLAKMAIINEDVETLTKIIELVPDLAVHNSDGTLFYYATQCNKTKSLQFFMEIVPELGNLETEETVSPIVCSIKNGEVASLNVFEANGYDFTQEILFKGKLVKPIQLAFEARVSTSFEYLLNKIGVENSLKTLLQIYGSKNEIMTRVMRPEACAIMARILRDRLGFDLNGNYTFGRKTGNVMIFFDNDDYYARAFKSELDL